MGDDAEKRAWIKNVLGIDLVSAESPQLPAGLLLPIWLDAKDQVDSSLGKLQQALQGFGDPDLDRIAEFGLNGVTGKNSVGLMVALREVDSREDDPGARAKLADAIGSYRAFLDGDPIVDLIEKNPFGVQLNLKATLGGALDALSRRIAS